MVPERPEARVRILTKSIDLKYLEPNPKEEDLDDYHLSFPRKSGHMIKFREGALHTVLGSYSLMLNDSSDDYRKLPRTQRCLASPPAW